MMQKKAQPAAVCGVGGTAKDCLRTLAPGTHAGNMDTQRIAVGSTLLVECFIDGCGLGMGDAHGAQGDD